MDRQAWWLICIIILISPITLTGVSTPFILFYDTLALLVCLLAITSKRMVVGERFILLLTLPFLLISTYFLFQIVPQSPDLLQLIVPKTWQVYQETIWKLNPGAWMPISADIEATVHAWFHMTALWVFCLSTGFLVDSHLGLLRFARYVVVCVTIWAGSLVLLSIFGQAFGDSIPWIELSRQRFVVTLGVWIVIFLPLLTAGYVACPISDRRFSLMGKFKNFLKGPKISLQSSFTLGILLAFVALVMTFSPILWLSGLTGYLIFQSFKPSRKGIRPVVHKKNIYFVTCLCTLALIIWIVQSPPLLPPVFNDTIGGGLSWFGYGLGALTGMDMPVGMNRWGKPGVNLGGGFAGLLSGLGGVGTFLFIVAILVLYHGAGGGKRVDQTDTINANLHAGCIAGIVLLVITGSLTSLWSWQSLVTCLVYLTLIALWCRRLSSLARGAGNHEISRWTARGLKGCVSLILITGALLGVIKLKAAFVETHQGTLAPSSVHEEDTGQWLKKIVDKFPYDTDFELFLGQWYLVQKRNGEAKAAIWSALKMRPLSPQVHVVVASLSACTGNESNARHFFSSTSASHYVPDNMTKFLVARLLGLPEQEAAVSLINLILGHSPQLASLYLNLMTLYGYEPLMIKSLVPEQPMVMLALGDLLLSEGHDEEGEDAYWSAVYNMDRDATRDEALFYRISSYFAENDRLSEALIAVREGLKHYPKSTSLKGLLADLHVRSSHEGH